MIDEKMRASLIELGWKPPAVSDYEAWRPALAAYYRAVSLPTHGDCIERGDDLGLSDKSHIEGIAAAVRHAPQ